MVRDERLQLGDEFAVATELEVRLDARLERRQLTVLEPRDLGLRPRLDAEVG